MKYVANPVVVDAFAIVAVGTNEYNYELKLDSGEHVETNSGMVARMTPQVGDYWVVQSDGYIYLNPKDVFERKYRPMVDEAAHA